MTRERLDNLVRAIIDSNRYMNLGTADREGRPWEDVQPPSLVRLYRATVSEHYVLIAGRDSSSAPVSAAREPITPGQRNRLDRISLGRLPTDLGVAHPGRVMARRRLVRAARARTRPKRFAGYDCATRCLRRTLVTAAVPRTMRAATTPVAVTTASLSMPSPDSTAGTADCSRPGEIVRALYCASSCFQCASSQAGRDRTEAPGFAAYIESSCFQWAALNAASLDSEPEACAAGAATAATARASGTYRMIRVEMDIACPFGSYRSVRYTRSSKRDPPNDPYATW
jgi:hypothetical protein